MSVLLTLIAAEVSVDLSGTADTVVGGFNLSVAGAGCSGGDCFLQIVKQVFDWIKPLFTILATFLIVRYGVALINSQEEEKSQKAKKMIGASVAAIMLLHLAGPLTDAFYGGYSAGDAGKAITTPEESARLLTTEMSGIVSWLETLVGTLAVTIIIVSGILAMTSYGKEEGGTQFKRTVGAVIFGVFLITVKQVILATFGLTADADPLGSPTIDPAIQKIVQVVSTFLEITGLLAAAVIVYAGLLMVMNFGNEEQCSKAKGILGRACIGLLAIGTSLAVIQLVMTIG
ncbi:hypothetical protein A3H90_02895 [Candidatus Peribacteria bacterium RIFCSPLOWO2_02_FULL_55_36]|nr:MAG: hypothetical protein A2789_00715 [Candidatus Peribacteria bacterium RIFCSPHIGHO2_01_FULL_54_22]OGJ63580.1 MAG: hypothetical protein A3D12_03995 [Candidatus Peribacteria bacterium RIFCSPHIGHO2_02_FULL_55_24]OGJ68867.1 MAG: hypothetical protein A2947_03750 [Candidatus Peribacteria bacterium RIFCSPLOWO2_01_FULL_54_110]OGJ69568.1 MAG: hypothetical protein A3H90_02895 [Candidatus Peribacteria bacterium RIFCSPLOWO2_02_FULL_55_36]